MLKKFFLFIIIFLPLNSFAEDKVIDVGDIYVTPSRFELTVEKQSKSIIVIDEKDIKDSQARTISEILSNISGLVVTDIFSNDKEGQIDIRGFGEAAKSNVLILVDGRRTNFIDMSGYDLVQLNIETIKKIEIIKIPQSVMYGDNANAGVINIITKKAESKDLHIGGKYETGSYKYKSFMGYIESDMDFLNFYGDIIYTDSSGYRLNGDLETIDVNAKINFKPVKNVKLKTNFGYHKDWYGLPGALYLNDIKKIGRRGTKYVNNKAKTEDGYIMLSPEIVFDSFLKNNVLTFTSDFIYRTRRKKTKNSWEKGLFWDAGTSERIDHIKTLGFTPRWKLDTFFLNRINTLIFGVDYYKDKDEILDGNIAFERDEIVIEKETLGIYISDKLELLPCLDINGGMRLEWAYFSFDQQKVYESKTTKRPMEYAWETGLSYKYNKRSFFYTNVSRSFRFPKVDEWWGSLPYGGGLNSSLKPQTAISYDIGIKDNTFKNLIFSAEFFFMDVKNELYYNPYVWENSNYDKTRHKGLDLSLDIYVNKHINIFGNYSYCNAYFLKGYYGGESIPLVPQNKWSVGVNLNFLEAFYVNYTTLFVGRRRYINDLENEHSYIKAYCVHNMKISIKKYDFEIFLAINNIFNYKYAVMGVIGSEGKAYYPCSGVNYRFGVTLKV